MSNCHVCCIYSFTVHTINNQSFAIGKDPVIARSVALEWSARPPSTLLLFVWNHLPAHPLLPCLSKRTLLTLSLSLQPVYSMYVWLLTCNLLEKIFYLFGMVSVLNTDCTVMFYVMRRTKLDPTCIYFKNILY